MDWGLLAAFAVVGLLEATFRSDLPWRAASLVVGVGLVTSPAYWSEWFAYRCPYLLVDGYSHRTPGA